MERAVKPIVALAAVAVIAVMAVGHGFAQSSGVLACKTSEFDFNQDGQLTKGDMNQFVNLATADGCWDSRVAEGTACGVYDLDGDQFVNDLDVAIPHAAFMDCIGGLSPSPLGSQQ